MQVRPGCLDVQDDAATETGGFIVSGGLFRLASAYDSALASVVVVVVVVVGVER